MGGADEEKQRIADLEKEIAKRDRWINQRDRRIDRLSPMARHTAVDELQRDVMKEDAAGFCPRHG